MTPAELEEQVARLTETEKNLTEPQRLVLDSIDYGAYPVWGRETFAADRPHMPHTIGLREAFDFLLAVGAVKPRYVISDKGRAMLAASPIGGGK